MRCSTRYCPSRRGCLGLSELLIHSVRQVLTQKCEFKAASGWLVAFSKLWLHNFYACLPGTLKIPLGACWKHWIAGCFQKSAPKCCSNLCAFYCATVEVSVRNGSIRKFKSNYAWLIPCHYGFVATLWEVFYQPHEKAKCVSCQGPCLGCDMAADVLDLPCSWRPNTQLALVSIEIPGLRMECISLVLPDPCGGESQCLEVNRRADHSAAHLSSCSFILRVGVWGHGAFLQCVQVRASLNSPGSWRRWREGGKYISDQVWRSEALKGEATLIRGPLGKNIPFLGPWRWRRWQALPPHSAPSQSRSAWGKAQGQVPVQYQLPNVSYEVASGCFLPVIPPCQGPSVLAGASTELPGVQACRGVCPSLLIVQQKEESPI